MPTTFTRFAGVTALLIPVIAIVGAGLNDTTNKNFWHGFGAFLMGLALPMLAVAIIGIRARHRGRLGRWGTASFVLFLASLVLAAPFGWGAGFVFAWILMIAAAVLAVGMLRARVLPRPPIVLFGVAGSVGLVVVCVGQALGVHMGNDIAAGVSPIELGAGVTACGLAWLGLAMAREEAVGASTAAPLATT